MEVLRNYILVTNKKTVYHQDKLLLTFSTDILDIGRDNLHVGITSCLHAHFWDNTDSN